VLSAALSSPRLSQPEFRGKLRDIDTGFAKRMATFVTDLLSSDNLFPLSIAGNVVHGMDLIHYFESYIDIFNSDQLPEAISLLNATAHATFELLLATLERNLHCEHG